MKKAFANRSSYTNTQLNYEHLSLEQMCVVFGKLEKVFMIKMDAVKSILSERRNKFAYFFWNISDKCQEMETVLP